MKGWSFSWRNAGILPGNDFVKQQEVARASPAAIGQKRRRPLPLRQTAFSISGPRKCVSDAYGLTVMRSLMSSNTSFGTTFLATNSPFTR